METVYFTGIDQHKRTSFLTTLDEDGCIVRSSKLKNNPEAIRAYFRTLSGQHHATVVEIHTDVVPAIAIAGPDGGPLLGYRCVAGGYRIDFALE